MRKNVDAGGADDVSSGDLEIFLRVKSCRKKVMPWVGDVHVKSERKSRKAGILV